ncbi:MAG: tol-pal system protein YbgF [Granulosicoccus sp.]|nr:tol-pal system protein YbgF [Granulosicoccus sp.]
MKCIKGVLLVIATTLTLPVLAQEKPSLENLDVRLSRIERVLDQSLLEQLQRVDALQREIRALRGEVESLSNQLNTINKRHSDLYDDTDRRITDLEEAQESMQLLDGQGNLAGTGLTSGSLADETTSILDETASPTGSEASPAVFVSQEGPVVPDLNNADFGDGPRPPRQQLRDTATNAEKLAYNGAYDLLARGQIPEAMQAFDQFLLQYPNGPYSDNAWYWQGEARYARQEFDLALRNFGVVIESFPESPKVPDARLKIGFSLYEKQEFDRARTILTSVQDDYPGRSASVLARKRLQKMDREGR